MLNFKEADKQLKLIDSKNVSVFVPLNIEIKYLKPYLSVLSEFELPYSEKLNGADVWGLYTSLIESQKEDFVNDTIKMKKLQGLMSNFTFSIFLNGKDYDSLRSYGEEKHGFLYLESYSEIYSFNDGINTERFKDSYFL